MPIDIVYPVVLANFISEIINEVIYFYNILDVKKNALYKYDLLTLDIIANNINERPIYFAVSVSPSSFMGFQKYFEQNGLTYRVVPRINASGQPTQSPINIDGMYDNVMNKVAQNGILGELFHLNHS